jgi:hypothetical protein
LQSLFRGIFSPDLYSPSPNSNSFVPFRIVISTGIAEPFTQFHRVRFPTQAEIKECTGAWQPSAPPAIAGGIALQRLAAFVLARSKTNRTNQLGTYRTFLTTVYRFKPEIGIPGKSTAYSIDEVGT